MTEPRRVAAISMSERVGRELNDKSLTGYQIRYMLFFLEVYSAWCNVLGVLITRRHSVTIK